MPSQLYCEQGSMSCWKDFAESLGSTQLNLLLLRNGIKLKYKKRTSGIDKFKFAGSCLADVFVAILVYDSQNICVL